MVLASKLLVVRSEFVRLRPTAPQGKEKPVTKSLNRRESEVLKMTIDGNIQIEAEALYDAYNLTSDELERTFIMQKIEALYASARNGSKVRERTLELV